MKITTISKAASLVISSVMIQTAVAGHDEGIGVGPQFGGGRFGGGIFGMLFGGGGFHSAPATANSRPQIASRVQQPSERAGNPVFSRQRASVHRYNNEGVYNGNPSPDPTVTAIQQDLTKLGYYHRSIDGLYGRATRDAVARYQTDHHLPATGTLTSQMLKLLRVSPTSRAETGSELGTNSIRERSRVQRTPGSAGT